MHIVPCGSDIIVTCPNLVSLHNLDWVNLMYRYHNQSKKDEFLHHSVSVWSRLMAAILNLSLKETPDHKIVARSGFLALKSVTTHVFCNVERYFDENII